MTNTQLRPLLVPATTFTAVTLALLSWDSFTSDPAAFLGPALLIGVVVVGSGVAGRALRLSTPLVVVGQTLLGLAATSIALTGSLTPWTGESRDRLITEFDQAAHTVMTAQIPVPVGGPGIGPYLIVGAFVCYLLADVLATTLRQPPLVGLVLLGVMAVPLSVPDGGLPWWAFVVVVFGYLLLLVVHEKERISGWGRPLEASAGIASVGASGERGIQAGAGAIGITATALALVLPVAIPTFQLDMLDFGQGGDGDGPIRVSNPTVGMHDDLENRTPTPLVRVRPSDPDAPAPSYLRISTLTAFNGEEWSPGSRKVPSDQTASGALDPPIGGKSVLGDTMSYTMQATDEFESTWLPTFVHATSIEADGDWRYDTETYDFLAADEDVTTAGMRWELSAAPVVPSKQQLLAAGSGTSGSVDARFTTLPTLPSKIEDIAEQRTAGYDSPFEQAVALQEWFRSSGEFRYSLDVPDAVSGTGASDLLHFLTDEKVGYCQQYATAMAVLARELNIPARVAVGFLSSERQYDGSYLFRAKDMHAWPELWFEGVGWVSFDPTPAARGTSAPAYTLGVLDGGAEDPIGPGAGAGLEPAPGGQSTLSPDDPRVREPKTTEPAAAAGAGAGEDHTAAVIVLVLLGLGVLLAFGLATPALVRRRRRSARLDNGPEAAWAELRDTAIDLGMPWSDGVSPRTAGGTLAAKVADTETREALERLVVAVERARYARTAGDLDVQPDLDRVRAGLSEAAEPRTVRRARLWPRSVFDRRRRSRETTSRERIDQRELVDHMG